METDLLTISAVADLLCCPKHVINYAIETNKISRPIEISKRRMFSSQNIEEIRQFLSTKKRKKKGGCNQK